MFILPSASLISRAAFEVAGGFDERLTGYEDDDLFLECPGTDTIMSASTRGCRSGEFYTGSASYSSRMAPSRMIYARKLFAAFPDDPGKNLFYARDLILAFRNSGCEVQSSGRLGLAIRLQL